jgi:hypothetical protein
MPTHHEGVAVTNIRIEPEGTRDAGHVSRDQ